MAPPTLLGVDVAAGAPQPAAQRRRRLTSPPQRRPSPTAPHQPSPTISLGSEPAPQQPLAAADSQLSEAGRRRELRYARKQRTRTLERLRQRPAATLPSPRLALRVGPEPEPERQPAPALAHTRGVATAAPPAVLWLDRCPGLARQGATEGVAAAHGSLQRAGLQVASYSDVRLRPCPSDAPLAAGFPLTLLLAAQVTAALHFGAHNAARLTCVVLQPRVTQASESRALVRRCADLGVPVLVLTPSLQLAQLAAHHHPAADLRELCHELGAQMVTGPEQALQHILALLKSDFTFSKGRLTRVAASHGRADWQRLGLSDTDPAAGDLALVAEVPKKDEDTFRPPQVLYQYPAFQSGQKSKRSGDSSSVRLGAMHVVLPSRDAGPAQMPRRVQGMDKAAAERLLQPCGSQTPAFSARELLQRYALPPLCAAKSPASAPTSSARR